MPHFFSHQRNKPLTNPKLAHLAEEWKQLTTLLPKATQTRWHSLLGVRHINNGNVCEEIKTWRRRQWQPTPVLLHGKSHGRRSLVGYSPWGLEESDTTERLHFHFSLSCIGKGNGNPLQCSCLENPRDGGAWWAAIYGVTQSQTQLKLLSNSSSTSRWRGAKRDN